MDKEKEAQIIENNKSISELLSSNENIIIKEGYKPPVSNYSVDRDDRIKIPAGYIRTAQQFVTAYHLTELVLDNSTRKNIAYALQLSDYYNYLVNRFYVWGSVETMFYKQMFVNIISVIEALINESANRINSYCKKCASISKCKKNINKNDRETMKCAATKLQDLEILNISSDDLERLIELYDYRNKVHIRLNEQNEFLDDKFNLQLYNESIKFLKDVDEKLYENAVPYYNKCMGFEKK